MSASRPYKKPNVNTLDETARIIQTMIKSTNIGSQLDSSSAIYGADYYNTLDDIGLTYGNQSVGSPTNNLINRYYDEKRNYSWLVPVVNPLNIYQLSRRVKQSIQENDYSESNFFSSTFEKQDISERFLEKNLVYSKKLEYYRINEIKQRQPIQQLIGLNLLVLDKLDNILRYITKEYILNKYEKQPEGKNFYTKSIFINGAAPTKIDFTELDKCGNLPPTFNYKNFPSTELFSLIVKLDSGGPIQIGINESDKDYSTYIDLAVNETHEISNEKATIKSLNIMANGADATCRIIGMF